MAGAVRVGTVNWKKNMIVENLNIRIDRHVIRHLSLKVLIYHAEKICVKANPFFHSRDYHRTNPPFSLWCKCKIRFFREARAALAPISLPFSKSSYTSSLSLSSAYPQHVKRKNKSTVERSRLLARHIHFPNLCPQRTIFLLCEVFFSSTLSLQGRTI